jgi:Fe-S-cluster containining protein
MPASCFDQPSCRKRTSGTRFLFDISSYFITITGMPLFREGSVFHELESHFEACDNCGSCCSIPGIFLPHEIDLLADRLMLDRAGLFRTYLIAELFTPDVESAPAFVIAPVKAAPDGGRETKLLSDSAYAGIKGARCIFRSGPARRCGIHAHKPFGCALLICRKMTKAGPLLLNKTYYYHRWIESQTILFSIFPGLERIYGKLCDTVSPLPLVRKSRNAALTEGNAIIANEMAELMNGGRNTARPFYRAADMA